MSTDELLAEALRLTRVDRAPVAEEWLSSLEESADPQGHRTSVQRQALVEFVQVQNLEILRGVWSVALVSACARVAATGRPAGRGGVSRDKRFSPSTRWGCSRTRQTLIAQRNPRFGVMTLG
jgi:hypothetical protein